MPRRKYPLVNNQIYHIYNRSVAQLPIFRNKKEYKIYLSLIEYYKFANPPLRFSFFSRLEKDKKSALIKSLYKSNNNLVNIYAFCLMPNHYHLLLKQKKDKGIMNYIRLIQNSYAHYINVKTKRCGSVFQSPFKAKRIESDEQFLHVARYIHLNPLTTYLIDATNELANYEWCSFKDYSGENSREFVDIKFLMSFYKNKDKFIKFTFDQLDYQRKLEKIKHLLID